MPAARSETSSRAVCSRRRARPCSIRCRRLRARRRPAEAAAARAARQRRLPRQPVVPATRPGCDAGFIIMEPTEYPPMSGSNTICTATVLLETGMVADARARDGAAAGGAGRRRRGPRRLPRRPLRERRVHERRLLRRPARRAARGRRAGHAHRRRRLRRHVVRDRRRGAPSASRSSPARRATSRWPASGSAPRRASSSLRPPREPRDRRRQHRPDRRALAGGRRGHPKRRRRRAGAARPLGDRHGPLGPDGRAPRARADEAGRRDDARLRDRLDVRRPDRLRDDVGDRPAIVPAIRGSAWITGISQLLLDPTDPFPEGYLLSTPGESAAATVSDAWGRPRCRRPCPAGSACALSRSPSGSRCRR